MLIIGQRIREYLLNNSNLLELLEGNNIFAIGAGPKQINRGIFISYSVGEDMNAIPASEDLINIYVSVSTSITNHEQICKDIVSKVDDLLNKKEHLISNETYEVLNFCRKGSGDFEVDNDNQEIVFMLSYSYILATPEIIDEVEE